MAKRSIRITSLLLASVLLLAGCTSWDRADLGARYHGEIEKQLGKVSLSYDRLSGMSDGVCLLPEDASFDETLVTASYAGLFSEDTGETLYVKAPKEKLYPASVTKCMTALIVLEEMDDFTREYVVPEEAYQGLSADASLAGLKIGYSYTLHDLMFALLLPSGNEAANMLAIIVSGSVPEFVKRMNRRAQELGMMNTSFKNPHGLHDPNHYTTVYDLYLLLRELSKHGEFTAITGTRSIDVTCRKGTETLTERYTTTNSFIREFVTPPKPITVLGGKTGYTVQAGRCLVLYSVDPAGHRYFSIIGKSKTYEGVYEDMNALLRIAAGAENE